MSAEAKPCSSCGALVVFATHDKTGKPAPLEQDPEGRWTIVHPHYFLAGPKVAPEHRWTNHFATCPGADAHRTSPAGGAAQQASTATKERP